MMRGIHTLPGGLAGSGGGGGSSTPAAITRFTQRFASPATTWTIVHSLGTSTPLVDVYDLGGFKSGADVHATDNNTVIVSFYMPFAGSVVVSKG